MKNIELKVKIENPESIIKKLKVLRAKYIGQLKQIDTYFNCNEGRLKLRIINNKRHELIFYRRPDLLSHKISEYEVISLSNKEARFINKILEMAYRIKVVINKKRNLWMFGNTRIHLDKVTNLGNYLELESQIKKNKKTSEKEYNYLIKKLSLGKLTKIRRSYGDLLNGVYDKSRGKS